MGNVEEIVRGLYRDMRELLLECPRVVDFVASDLAWSRPGPTGHALTRLAARGLLTQHVEPSRRRLRYCLTDLGMAAQDLLSNPSKKGE